VNVELNGRLRVEYVYKNEGCRLGLALAIAMQDKREEMWYVCAKDHPR
jgi:hypothetical protein